MGIVALKFIVCDTVKDRAKVSDKHEDYKQCSGKFVEGIKSCTDDEVSALQIKLDQLVHF